MDIVNAASARADFYDRNAEGMQLGWSAAATAPHGLTVRDTYTVPASRKAIINSLELLIVRDLVGGINGYTQAWFSYTPFGGVAAFIAQLGDYNQVIGSKSLLATSPTFVMYPGDILTVNSADSCGGGTNMYALYGLITEFDY